MKKIFKIIVWIIGFLTVLAVAAVSSGYLWSFRLASETLTMQSMVTLTPAGDVPLGESVRYSIVLELPVCRKIEKAVAEPGVGCIAAGSPVIRRGAWKWSRQLWHIEGELRLLRPGEVIPGVLTVEASGKDGGAQVETAVIPGFTILPLQLPPDARPELAGAVDVSSGRTNTLWFLLLIPAGVLCWFIWHRRAAPERILPPWEQALAALRQLGDDLSCRRITPENGFLRLTDLVRNYLELRFSLPAPARTTAEFLEELNDPGSPLPAQQRPFLREFLEAADQVKFAKAPPDDALLHRAIARAGELIESTGIKENDEKEVRHV